MDRPSRVIPLSELPKWSPWPARLLGLEPWASAERTLAKVEAEYDGEKYAALLRFYLKSHVDRPGPEALQRFECGYRRGDRVCVARGGELLEMGAGEALAEHYGLMLEHLGPVIREAEVVIELGCGYGYNLWRLKQRFPGKRYLGGELSRNAVRLAGLLWSEDPGIRVEPFNFYDEAYSILEGPFARRSVVAFTLHALEQLPCARHAIQTLASYGEVLRAVVHLEPAYDLHDASLLGLMRRRYAEVNDYNRDLYACLQAEPRVRITRAEGDLFGLNPLNPTSAIHWEPRGSECTPAQAKAPP